MNFSCLLLEKCKRGLTTLDGYTKLGDQNLVRKVFKMCVCKLNYSFQLQSQSDKNRIPWWAIGPVSNSKLSVIILSLSLIRTGNWAVEDWTCFWTIIRCTFLVTIHWQKTIMCKQGNWLSQMRRHYPAQEDLKRLSQCRRTGIC